MLSPASRPGKLAELGLRGGATSLTGQGSNQANESELATFGFSLNQGKRANMEDFHHAEVCSKFGHTNGIRIASESEPELQVMSCTSPPHAPDCSSKRTGAQGKLWDSLECLMVRHRTTLKQPCAHATMHKKRKPCHAARSGHGGPNAADYVRGNLFNNLLQHAKFPSDLHCAIGEMPDCQLMHFLSHDPALGFF